MHIQQKQLFFSLPSHTGFTVKRTDLLRRKQIFFLIGLNPILKEFRRQDLVKYQRVWGKWPFKTVFQSISSHTPTKGKNTSNLIGESMSIFHGYEL